MSIPGNTTLFGNSFHKPKATPEEMKKAHHNGLIGQIKYRFEEVAIASFAKKFHEIIMQEGDADNFKPVNSKILLLVNNLIETLETTEEALAVPEVPIHELPCYGACPPTYSAEYQIPHMEM